MHLLAAQDGVLFDGTDPVDPNQSPADIIILSAADTELACLARANRELDTDQNFLRLASLAWFSHPYSVDLYIDQTALRSRLVIIRALGGISYWKYCIESMSNRLGSFGIKLAVLPGDNKFDSELKSLSSIKPDQWEILFDYCREGGLSNAKNLLLYCRHIIFDEPSPQLPAPMLHAGLYWPGTPDADFDIIKRQWDSGAAIAGLVFYRALLQGGNLEPIDCLIDELMSRGINPLPVYTASLKDTISSATVTTLFDRSNLSIILNATCFALSSPGQFNNVWQPTVLNKYGCPVLQVALAATDYESWKDNSRGLIARDIAMNVALTELDGNIFTRAVGFKTQPEIDNQTQLPISAHSANRNRIEFVSELTSNWIRLQKTKTDKKRIALLLANYPNKDGRLANGVGLDTPESIIIILQSFRQRGYNLANEPLSGDQLMQSIQTGPTNALVDHCHRSDGVVYSLDDYLLAYEKLPFQTRCEIESRWGKPNADPYCNSETFHLSIKRYGNIMVGIQPARGYNINPVDTYHSPDLVPPHNYLAFYFWIRNEFDAHAIIHVGKHGNLEWLPGKSVALGEECYPEVVLGPIPNIYPFIVNDPGEGTQAKRRIHSIIIDHLTPPLARAESYGQYIELEGLLDEYYEASDLDARRAHHLKRKILEILSSSSLNRDIGIPPDEEEFSSLQKLDAYLCDLKESQIRNGLHIFGKSPEGDLERDLTAALLRIPSGTGDDANTSFIRAIAMDFQFDHDFDPLDCNMAEQWTGDRPGLLQNVSSDAWRTVGDTVERIELLALKILDGETIPPGFTSKKVMEDANTNLRPLLASCGNLEMSSLLSALDGSFIIPGPSGAPSRGRIDVLPTGRNFYSIDNRSLPTRTAWEIGWKSASLIIERYLQDNGDWPECIAVTAWATANMRTGGDDIAQALALMGTKPKWDDNSTRVIGYEIIPMAALGRPRVDVTLRVSGLFRDSFPSQMDLFANAAKAVMELDEPITQNPARKSYLQEVEIFGTDRAGYRVFGSKPGAYGAGMQTLVDEKLWQTRDDFGKTYIEWGNFAYGNGVYGEEDRQVFSSRLSLVDAVVQNQDNREHDILDSDDYYQFEGGIAAAVEHLRGQQPKIYHNDHSRPERPVIRTLSEEIGRVVRSRAANPKWIDGVKRHGYKGAFEIAATVDYLFAFAATTGAAQSYHFDIVYNAYLEDADTREFIRSSNPSALYEIAERFQEAIDRNLWQPRSNSSRELLRSIIKERNTNL